MFRWAISLLWLVSVAGVASGAEKVPQYVGADGCKNCHKKELMGDQHNAWLEGPHHGAFETLKSPEAKKIATERGLPKPPHEAPECLKCHATSHGLTPAQIKKKPLVAADGVQCESCHGPGSLYKKKKTMASHEKSVAAGMWEPDKDAKICTTCHNDESPTFEGFDFEARKKDIAHPIPKEVKGRYLEEVKLRKARGGAADDEDEEEDE